MIIKSMARKVPSFGQLIDYFHKEKFYRKAPTFAHNLWGSNDPDKIAEEFDHNATFLPKRANGNYMYHEVIVLGEYPDISSSKQERIPRYFQFQARTNTFGFGTTIYCPPRP